MARVEIVRFCVQDRGRVPWAEELRLGAGDRRVDGGLIRKLVLFGRLRGVAQKDL
jgi:hypothetical protein